MSKTVLTSFTILCLLSTVFLIGLALNIQTVKAFGIIYIRADGSVEGTNKIQRDGDVYTFTDNIYDSTIVVELDNIMIEGAGYTLHGTGAYNSKAFHISGRSNVTIKNMTITMFHYGIDLSHSSNNTISGNKITNNTCSVGLCFSSNHNSIYGNNITISNDYAIFIAESSNNSISENNIRVSNFNGITLQFSSNNKISGNNISNNSHGIWLERSSNNNISGNSITANNDDAVWFNCSSNNAVIGNAITNNDDAIILGKSSNNTISENNVTANYGVGIGLWNSSDNFVYHNIFANNPPQIYTENSVNVWDNSYPSGGNYWSDYNGTDSNQDGIGNTLYEIDENNIDHYPLVGMYASFSTSLSYDVNVVSNSTIESFEYFEFNGTIKIYISGEEGLGFCRVSIPHVLMNVSDISVVIDDGLTPVLYHNYTLYDNGTNRWIYFAYEHSTHKIDIIPEFPSFLILSLFMTVTLLAVIIYRRKKWCCNITPGL